MAHVTDHARLKTTGYNVRGSRLIRGLDLVASGLGLLALAPLFALIGLAIKRGSPGPVFHRAERVGRGGRRFKLYKFRTMVQDAERLGPGVTGRGDPRVTPLGRVLRGTKLDELPQLINVLLGHMSLVGPRPEDPRYVALYDLDQRRLLALRPGITSHASLHYIEEEAMLSGEDWEETYRRQVLPHKLSLDLAYLRERTAWTDVLLILKTVGAVLRLPQWIELVQRLRNRHLLGLDALTLLILPALALALRLDGFGWWPGMAPALLVYSLAALFIKLAVFYELDLYDRYWRYAGVNDLARVVLGVGLASGVVMLLFTGLHPRLEPYGLAMFRSVPIIDGLLTGLIVAGYRFALRSLYHWQRRNQNLLGGRRVLVVGAGEAGILAVHEMRSNPQLDMQPVAFVDDDPAKAGTRIQGLPVLGPIERIPELAARGGFERILLAIPSVPLGRRREVKALCGATGLAMQDLPGVYEILAGHKTVSRLGRVDAAKLLRREPVAADAGEVEALLGGQVVLVTGAGGSIGGELCRQVARCRPAELILLGHGENSIFEIAQDLRHSHPELALRPAIADVRDAERLRDVIGHCRPRVIFHAAAHKHVPLMEANAEEALTTNVLGTRNVLRAACACDVERLVLISTDKAVNPSSVMGASKRLAEMLAVATAARSGRAYMAVRFGNVLGSRGSVVPIFQRQIAAGGPLTITHPDMSRYFMTIPEAVQLVLEAAVLGVGGEVFVLDMGQPVRILDLAQEMIRQSGLKPGRDIEVVFSGVRPGEKLSEELFLAREVYRRTRHSQVFAAATERPLPPEALDQLVDDLVALAARLRGRDAMHELGALLPCLCRHIDQSRPEPLPSIADPAPTSAPEASLASRNGKANASPG